MSRAHSNILGTPWSRPGQADPWVGRRGVQPSNESRFPTHSRCLNGPPREVQQKRDAVHHWGGVAVRMDNSEGRGCVCMRLGHLRRTDTPGRRGNQPSSRCPARTGLGTPEEFAADMAETFSAAGATHTHQNSSIAASSSSSPRREDSPARLSRRAIAVAVSGAAPRCPLLRTAGWLPHRRRRRHPAPDATPANHGLVVPQGPIPRIAPPRSRSINSGHCVHGSSNNARRTVVMGTDNFIRGHSGRRPDSYAGAAGRV